MFAARSLILVIVVLCTIVASAHKFEPPEPGLAVRHFLFQMTALVLILCHRSLGNKRSSSAGVSRESSPHANLLRKGSQISS